MKRRETVCLVGVGLMGGSLGLALRRVGGFRVVGVGRSLQKLRRAKRRGCVDVASTDWRQSVQGADVVVLAVPVSRVVPLAKQIRPFLSPRALVMDVGSVKGPIVESLSPLFSKRSGPAFVGAHPMAGSEKSGVEFACADLYRGAPCVLTPDGRTPPEAVKRASQFWRRVGARPLRLTPRAHDAWVGLVSHLPHLVADALTLTAGQTPGAERWVTKLSAGSFRDTTRVAGADPHLWADIFKMNQRAVAAHARVFQNTISRLLRQRFPAAQLKKAQRLRSRFIRTVNKGAS